VELVLLNSHDAGCAYQIHAGIHRRICSNALVISESGFQATLSVRAWKGVIISRDPHPSGT